MDFFKNLIPFPSIKLPKLKKLRQWTQESLLSLNLSQLTGRGNNNNNNSNNNYNNNNNSNNNNTNHKSNCYDDNIIKVPSGISTISGAILDLKIDPKRDNFGLYALKCDRSSSLASAKRGILLTLPTTKPRTRAEINSQQSVVERTHEVFESCEKIQDADDGIIYAKIEPPPRKKKLPTATKHLVVHQKMLKKPPIPPPKAINRAEQSTIKKDSFDKIESGLYRIVNTQASEKAQVSVEDPVGNKKEEHVVTMVKPTVQKAIVVKATPLCRQITKVKSFESNESVKKSPVKLNKVHPKKRSTPSESGSSQQTSVDIFKPSHSVDQKQDIFDEFDALFDKSRQASEDLPAFKGIPKLNELKFSSSSFSSESSNEEKQEEVDGMELRKCIKIQDFHQSNLPRVKYLNSLLKSEDEMPVEDSTKPRIISEQPKVLPTSYTTQKVIYYDDKKDILSYQQLVLNQNQSTTIINNHFNAQVLDRPSNDNILNDSNKLMMKTDDKVPIKSILTTKHSSTSDAIATDYDNEDTVCGHYDDLRNNNTSNNLRIFSNEGVFVFNL